MAPDMAQRPASSRWATFPAPAMGNGWRSARTSSAARSIQARMASRRAACSWPAIKLNRKRSGVRRLAGV